MFRRLVAVLLAGSLLTAPTALAQPGKGLRAGAYAIDVTPKTFPISVNGGMTDRQAKSAHDRLHARCLVLDDGTHKLAIAVVDSCLIPRTITDAAKQLVQKSTGIPPECVLISATHTHTAPTVTGAFQSEPDAAYVRYLTERIAEGIAKAHAQREPARLGWTVGRDPTQVFNRRWRMKPGSLALRDPFGRTTDKVKMNPGYKHADLVAPAGPIDPEITILSVRARDDRPIALLANYSLHYVGGLPALSADYYGVYAEKMKTLLGAENVKPPFVGIMSNGTSGDINNVNFAKAAPGKQAPGEQIRIVAESVAAATMAALKNVKYSDKVALASAQKEIELAVRRPTPADVKRAEDILAKANKKVLSGLEEVYARETVLLAKYPPTVKLLLQAHRIGPVGVCAVPCEVFVEIGQELKKRSPLRPTFTIELANGYNGYLPTPEQHALGGYETWRARSSYLETGASRRITATLFELLDQVAGQRK